MILKLEKFTERILFSWSLCTYVGITYMVFLLSLPHPETITDFLDKTFEIMCGFMEREITA